MAHELDTSTGKPAIAFIGETPWHGLGQQLQPGADLLTWQQESGLDWECLQAGVKYDRVQIGTNGVQILVPTQSKNDVVLYRSDTGEPLSIVSNRYRPVQPKQIIEFYRDLTEQHGFELETAGSLKGGRKIWALANTKKVAALRGDDVVKGYLLLATSFDGTMATQVRFTSVRVVCNNTITIATEGKADVTVPHSSEFKADKVKLELNIGDAWDQHTIAISTMANTQLDKDQFVRFAMNVYFGDAVVEAKDEQRIEKFFERMKQSLFNSPGSHMASARGTLWGALNAVTHDVDFVAPARTQENRLNSAWFGKGNAIKQRAWDAAVELLK